MINRRTTTIASIVLALCAGTCIYVAGSSYAATPHDMMHQTIKTGQTNGQYIFKPAKKTVMVGTKITWVNSSDASHTVTFQKNKAGITFDKTFGANAKLSFTFKKVGTYHYVCTFHPGMTGTITVKK